MKSSLYRALASCGWLLVPCPFAQAWLTTKTTPFPRTSSATSITQLAMSSDKATAVATTTTTTTRQPRLPLPEPLRSTTPGTWSHDTMSRRVDGEILARTVADNQAWLEEHPVVAEKIETLRKDLRSAAPLKYPEQPPTDADPKRKEEYQAWCDILQPHVDQQETWLSAPWMVAEFYVYRALMDCLGYWDADSPGYRYDPFAAQKSAGLTTSTASAEAMLQRIPNLPATDAGEQVAFSMALWGNKMDLSLWPADNTQTGNNTDVFSGVLAAAHENLLHDDSEPLSTWCETLRKKGGGVVDIIVDNAGFELVTDLALAQYLVQAGVARTVRLQLKSHPTFVSDALAHDVRDTVEYYAKQLDETKFPAARAAGQIWQSHLDDGTWQLCEHSFWVQGAAMWRMPQTLYDELQQTSDLAVVKGDANYRRLLGDLAWNTAAPFDDVVGAYFPCPVVALRTLKAEILVGCNEKCTTRAQALDKDWMVNGRFGVVHFSMAARNKSPKN